MRLSVGCIDIHYQFGDFLELYHSWPSPIVIISDGAYGIDGFDGDAKSCDQLREWYEPHIKAWTERASYQTTLWFWGTELSWATVHPLLVEYQWRYKACNIWNKGIAHIAGNVNTKTITHLPVVTEVCVQYIREPVFVRNNSVMSMQDWLRQEWKRTGLPFSKANEACGVKNAASRKYFSADHQWYFPPAETMSKIREYANLYGDPAGKPYFSLPDELNDISFQTAWNRLQAKFHCPVGITNVWDEPALRGKERIKMNGKAFHSNQKPIKLIERIIALSSDRGDVVWDAFSGVATGAIASINLRRNYYGAEINPEIYKIGAERIRHYIDDQKPDGC